LRSSWVSRSGEPRARYDIEGLSPERIAGRYGSRCAAARRSCPAARGRSEDAVLPLHESYYRLLAGPGPVRNGGRSTLVAGRSRPPYPPAALRVLMNVPDAMPVFADVSREELRMSPDASRTCRPKQPLDAAEVRR
jgi:hypothetical protein